MASASAQRPPAGTDAPPRQVPRNTEAPNAQEKAWYQDVVDQTLASSLMHRYGNRRGAGGRDPVPGLRRRLLHHRNNATRRRRRFGIKGEKRCSDALLKTSPIADLMSKLAGLDQPGGDPPHQADRPAHRRRPVPDHRGIRRHPRPSSGPRSATSARSARPMRGGLLAAGLGFEHFLDLRFDEKERLAGLEGGTPRTIEGPLWIADAAARARQRPPRSGPGAGRRPAHARPGPRHRRQPGAARHRRRPGTPTPRVAIPSSTARNRPGTCAARSRPMPRASISSAPSCPPATASRPMAPPTSCSRRSAATAIVRRTSTSSCRRRATGS